MIKLFRRKSKSGDKQSDKQTTGQGQIATEKSNKTTNDTTEQAVLHEQQETITTATVQQSSQDSVDNVKEQRNKAVDKIDTESTLTRSDESQADDKTGFFARLKGGLSRTRESFTEGLADTILGKKHIDAELLEEIETQLLVSDVGLDATQVIIDDLSERVRRKEVADPKALWTRLQMELAEILRPVVMPFSIDTNIKPYVILMVGVNGSGKTTTIGKLTKRLQKQGKKIMLAAGDTFRAAATEQLIIWGERNDVPVIAQQQGADSASVIFDALQAAKARNYDVLIADTAGRLHTQTNLMEELKKVKRVIGKIDPQAPHEIMLVLDAGIGQNALVQAEQFNTAVGVTGITVTKLDGTAKGGILFAIAKKMGIPIRFIGVGEQIDDLRPFDAVDFTKALLDLNSN